MTKPALSLLTDNLGDGGLRDSLGSSLSNQVLCSAVEVSGFNPRRTTRRYSLNRTAAASASAPQSRQQAKGIFRRAAAHSTCPRPRLGAATEAASRLRLLGALGGGDRSWARTSFLHRRQQNNPAAGTELLAAVSVRGAAMGSVLSSDSGKSSPASVTPRALERRRDPELPVTSFDCSVCLEVLHQPVRTRCGHVFCRSCIATSLKNNKWTCPYCRAYLPSEGVPAADVAKRMKSEYQNCAECDTPVCLSEMRAHIRTCQKYIDKYGPLQELGETAARCVCPFCQRELDEDSLLDHCITHHRSERRLVFCPLCRLIPNENQNSFSGSLIRHLQVNHTLFYDDFIDFNIIEEALIRRVLDRSLLEYVNHSNTT